MRDDQKSREQLLDEVRRLRERVAAQEPAALPAGGLDPDTAQAVIRSSPAAIVILDMDARVLVWSPAAERLFGWREQEVVGQRHPIIPPEAWDSFMRDFRAHLEGHIIVNDRRRRRRKDGSWIDVRLSTAPLRNAEGQVIGVVGLLAEAGDGAAPATSDDSRTFRQLLDRANEGIWMLDAEGVTLFVNEPMAAMLATRPERVARRPLIDFVSEADRPHVAATLQRGEEGVSGSHELWIRREDGGGLWTHFSAMPLHDQEGRFTGTLAVVTDVTPHKELESALEQAVQQRTAELTETNRKLRGEIAARRAAEQALRDSEERYRLLAENATDLIARHRPDGTFLYLSPSCQRLLGYRPGELVGQSPYDYFHPDDIAAVRRAHEQVLDSADISTVVARIRHKDGRYVWFETLSRSIPEPDGGQVRELQTASRDITTRRATEERLLLVRAAVEQADDMVVITEAQLDPPGPRIEYVNPAFCRITGYAPEEVIGRTPRILQGPRTSRAVLDRLRETLAQGRTFHGETYNYRKNGEEFVLNWHIAPVRDDQGRITHWVSIQRDVTERKRAEAEARQRQAELAHVSRLSTMGEMASGLAHELNQPLAAISIYMQGSLRRLRAGTIDPHELEEALGRVASQAERAGEIIRRLRNFVRKREPKRTSAQANHLVRDVVALMETEIRQHSVNVQLELTPDLPAVVVDPVQIEQVVLNLVRNGIEAMDGFPPEERQLLIRTRFTPEARVEVTVSDRGRGIDAEQLKRIFEPFFTTKSQGMGMGLNISQSIVEAHGGRLWAEPNPDRGVSFHLTLPVSAQQR